MKKQDVKIGKVYLVTVSGKRARVRLTGESPYGGWDGLNIDTRRKVRIKTAGRLQRQIDDPDAPATTPQPEPEPETIPTQPEAPEAQEVHEATPETTPEEMPEAEGTEEPERAETAPEATQTADTPPEPPPADQESEAATEATSGNVAPQETPLTKLSIPELQARYREVVGRDTSSSNRNYMIWKVKQAIKGRIPIGPRTRRTAGEAGDFKVLPLRMEAELVKQLDEARERLGLQSRMELFRRSLHAYLLEAGEVRVAEMFAAEA